MELPSTEHILLIAGIVVFLMILGWMIVFRYRSKREGFQTPTAESIDIKGIVQAVQNSPVDKDMLCPMLEVQFNIMNQQYLAHQKNGNAEKTEKFNEMLNNLKNAHKMYGCTSEDST